MKEIAVLLTVYNRRDKTLKCLSELFQQKIPSTYNLKVYMTNDGCTDGTPEAVSDAFPSVHIIKGDGTLFWNRGMWTAWNVASKEKDYDYYLWLNDDTYLYEDAIKELLESAEKKDNSSIIVGACLASDKKSLTYGGRKSSRKSEVPIPNGSLEEVETFNGNIVLVPKSVFHKIGNLDYYYRHSHGDLDYGLRAHSAGIKSYQVGVVLVECDRHEKLNYWGDPAIPLRKRLKILYSPIGFSPIECFHSERKHYNICMASFHFVTVHLRCLFPTLWLKYKGIEKR